MPKKPKKPTKPKTRTFKVTHTPIKGETKTSKVTVSSDGTWGDVVRAAGLDPSRLDLKVGGDPREPGDSIAGRKSTIEAAERPQGG